MEQLDEFHRALKQLTTYEIKALIAMHSGNVLTEWSAARLSELAAALHVRLCNETGNP